MYHPFSIAETTKTAWSIFKRNLVPLIVYSIISIFINELVDFFKSFIFIDNSQVGQIVTFFIQMLVQSYLVLSFYKLILALMDKEYYEFDLKEIIPSFKMAFSFILIACLYAIIIVILLFISSQLKPYPVVQLIFQIVELFFILFLLLRSIFCICFIVDDDSRPFESLRQSFEITKDNFFKTLAILFITIAIMIVALIPVLAIIGLFNLNDDSHGYLINLAFYVWEILFLPFVQVIIMVTYRKLVYSHQDVDDDFAETN